MKIRNVRYLTREGIKSINTNKLMSVASIAVLLSCLVMVGFAVLLFLNIDSLLETIEAENVIMVFVDKGSDDATVQKVGEELKSLDNVADVEFVSREDAFDTVLDSLGENAAILMDADNSFLPDGYAVTVNNMQNFALTVNQIRNIEHICSIRENSDLAARLAQIRTAVGYVSIGVVVVLLIVSLFIIANTVKITMFTRRLEISIMKAVGATNWFIRWPFLIEGIFIGVISACCSMVVLYLIYFFAGDALQTIFGILGGSLVNFWDYALYLFAAFILISVITGGFGSMFSISRYLKERGSVVVDENN